MNNIIPLDYSQKANWCKLPSVSKEVDTFYVYATEYILGSMAEGAPDYADMDNQEMLEGAEMITLKQLSQDHPDYPRVVKLYVEAFKQVIRKYTGVEPEFYTYDD